MIKKSLRIIPLLWIFLSSQSFSQLFFDENTIKFSNVLQIISRFYVDTVNENKLTEHAIVEMLAKLDPHSTYIPKEEVREMTESLRGDFEGIGVSFNILEDTIYIVSAISGGPSEKVGIISGDRIVTVDGKNVAGIGISNKGVRDRLLGAKGTKVTVGIKRKGVSELIDFTITRDKIPIFSLDAAYMIDSKTAYIKLNRFSMTTLTEFLTAVDSLKKQNFTDLVLDLSDNGGGYLEIAFKLADQFLENNNLIVYTQGINSPKSEYKATSNGVFEKGRLIVLIDESSASASEIVSGAIQDWDRGIIVGRRSFGKGLVQRPFELRDSSEIRLTIAKYYTPTGRCIQKSYEKGNEDYSRDIIKRYNSGELTNADSIHFPKSEKYFTLRNKRIVYGGGGIMPDFFVPIDTSFITDYYRKLIAKGILNNFILSYLDQNRKKISTDYSKFADFKVSFTVSDEFIEELFKYAEKNKLARNEKDIAASKKQIALIMKAYIARDVWGANEFYQIINLNYPALEKAMEILNDSKLYTKKLNK